MIVLFILFIFMPLLSYAMDKPHTPSAIEEAFLKRVLGLGLSSNLAYIATKEAEFDKKVATLQQEKRDIDAQLSSLHSKLELSVGRLHSLLKDIEWQEKLNLEKREKYEQDFQEKETYEQFIRWRLKSSPVKLRDLRFLFNKMALENNVEGMEAIEALLLEWKLITHAREKSEKLDYYGSFIDAVDNGQGDAAEYLVNKNISLKNTHSSLLGQICWEKWGSSQRHGFKETQQTNIVRTMIKKGVPSRLDNIRMYLLIAQESDAPERLIKYLKEVETSRTLS